MRRIKINTIFGLLITSIVFTILNGGVTYFNIREKGKSNEQIVHSYKTIQSSTQLLALLMDMETSQRGYIITSDSAFLDSYYDAKAMVQSETEILENLVHKNMSDSDHIELAALIAISDKFQDLETTLYMFKTFGKDSANSRLATKSGKKLMDTLRLFVNTLVSHEKIQLAEQNLILAHNKKLDPLRFSGFVLVGITCFLAFVTIRRKDRRNALLLKKLKSTNEELEAKVKDRTKKLVEANRAKDHFLGIVTHDLKAPIHGVRGLVELMKMENRTIRRNDMDEYLAHIEDSCKKMLRLISDTLDINRIEQGLANVKKENVDLNKLLGKIEKEFSHQARKKNIQLTVDIIDDIIETDFDALSRILENLLSNAIKFSPAYKTVQLKVINIKDHIQFKIIDEGPGISTDEMPKLFEKFQRLANKPTSKESSTGLGLSIVKELTMLLDGNVVVESIVGTGTTFTVSIPYSGALVSLPH
jgi:signal transduction histidine kinase